MQTIERVPNKKENYTVSYNEFIKDHRLSYKAKGLLITRLSLPDNFIIRVRHLATLTSDGPSTIASGLRELEHFGYAEFVRARDSKTGQLTQYWIFFERSKKPDVKSLPAKKGKKSKQESGEVELFNEADPNSFESPSLVPVAPESEIPTSVNHELLNTKEQIQSEQVLRNKINTSRESTKEPPPISEIPKDSALPESWKEAFQKIYKENHNGSLGESSIEEKSMKTLFQMTSGDWKEVAEKIAILIEFRNGYELFWRRQVVSPETILKFWSRLIRVEEVKTEKRNYDSKKNIKVHKVKNPEHKDYHKERYKEKLETEKPKTAHDCFLIWASEYLPPAACEFYKTNREPSDYKDSKRIIYDKYFAEIAPPQFRAESGVNACDIKRDSLNKEEKIA
ncbi:hypothetical protein [Leptospira kmetyi]|uniref:hypothetical protein n=1 Tax=Leptospira kmetyi TaxID=408139 RepID=UPI0002889F4B|nr:hypothetical protein [Leptospira kmetyi]